MTPHKLFFYTAISSSLLVTASAVDFTNGGFESNTGSSPTGWTIHSGTWATGNYSSTFTATTNTYGSDSAVITNNTATDSNTNKNLKQVYSGSNSFRLGNSSSGDHWASASQILTNYNASSMSFAFAAVLQNPGHLLTQNPRFVFFVKDQTIGSYLYNVSVTADANSTDVTWNTGLSNWKYSNWNYVNLNTSSAIGHTVEVFVGAYDCSLGGHGGYAYIDGFSTTTPATPNAQVNRDIYPIDPAIPEPSTYGLIGLGALVLAIGNRRRKKA